jgi:hypothetical protein
MSKPTLSEAIRIGASRTGKINHSFHSGHGDAPVRTCVLGAAALGAYGDARCAYCVSSLSCYDDRSLLADYPILGRPFPKECLSGHASLHPTNREATVADECMCRNNMTEEDNRLAIADWLDSLAPLDHPGREGAILGISGPR